MTYYYRIQPADRNPEDLLDPANQRSELWTGVAYRRCDDCGGYGQTLHRCHRCGGARCDWCDQYGSILEDCATCHGTGEIDDTVREGVSCCPTLDVLYAYFRGRHANLDNCVVVTLEGELADEEDWDADAGAVLIRPTRIVSVEPLDPAVIEEIEAEEAW